MSNSDPDEDEESPDDNLPAAGDELPPAELDRRLRRGEPIAVLDVRDRDEHERWRVEGPAVATTQVPYVEFLQAAVRDELDERFAETGLDEPAVVVCAVGESSGDVADRLADAGIRAVNLAGGMEAWARYGRAIEVATGAEVSADGADVSADGADVSADGADVVQFVRPATGCLSYLVAAGAEAAVIDPLRAFAADGRYASAADERDATVRWAIDTHVHADHVSGVRAVAERTGAEPVLPAGASERGLEYDATLVDGGSTLAVGDATLSAIDAPGHTSELQVYRLGDVLFSADCVFLDGVGRPDLEAGDEGAPALANELYYTLNERLAGLPADLAVAPGHVGTGTRPDDDGRYVAQWGELRDRLAAFGADEDAFVDSIVGDAADRPANYERIVDVNLGRADADEDDAFELELGPNNCAVSAV